MKEVRVGSDRFVVCHNPERADYDKATRENIVAHLETRIATSDALSKSALDVLTWHGPTVTT